ncbi:MAG TPA: cryptochrome/photolyase family protein [Luteibaculaceae bacterium]|nr:cryptochrome/photolyase family protein [Luteibaculaceae bacterium]
MLAHIVLPHQLFWNTDHINPDCEVYMVEEHLFFKEFNFHKIKLVHHRASMQYYRQLLVDRGFVVNYIDATDHRSDIRRLLTDIKARGAQTIRLIEPDDDWMERRIKKTCAALHLNLLWQSSPLFATSREALDTYHRHRKRYFQNDFYIWQRKQRNILLEGNNQPRGGMWSFDEENRQKFPKTAPAPTEPHTDVNAWHREAQDYVEQQFPNNPGDARTMAYPVTHESAIHWLQHFLQHRLEHFGTYEDAITPRSETLYHSVLTPMLNCGLITPDQILEMWSAALGNSRITLNNHEGFVRQIIGWREYIRYVYLYSGRKQRTQNYFGFKEPIPAAFYSGTTGILPVDHAIQKTQKMAYNHHIERLMILGNFMLLCEIDPNEVYRWFMEMYIDAYDWVMVPNVYGMSQFADGGLMCTKPYISSSNYILKMSDYAKGPWCEIWDGLYWRFIDRHRQTFTQNARSGMMVVLLDKMPAEKKERHFNVANQFLERLYVSV